MVERRPWGPDVAGSSPALATMQTGWIDGMSAAEYLADPCDKPSLSSSIAHLLLTKSPRHAWRAHPKLGAASSGSTESQALGTVVHAMLLGEAHRFDLLDVEDYKTKAAREARDASLAAGRIPVKRGEMAEHAATAETIRDGLRRFSIDLEASARRHTERVAVWEESGVQCRARLDCVDGATVYDLKTTRDASPLAIERAVRTYDYHVQRAAYVSAVEHVEPRLAGRVRFVLLFVETDTLEVVPVELGGGLVAIGVDRWRRAVDAWSRCLKAGTWPGYAPAEPLRIECSDWASTADQVAALELRERMAGL
jgi:hypothetical protein